MAVVPLSGSNIHFLKGVPFSNDGKHTRWFDDENQQVSYFNSKSKVHTMTEATFIENNSKAYVSVNAPIDELREVSYMRFQNTQYNSKWFYGFVTKLERKNRAVTYVYFQIDVLQTWLFDMKIKPSFVVREHCPLWNPDGSPVVNTVDEGLDYGSNYHNVKVDIFNPNDGLKFIVIVLKELIHGTNAKKTQASTVGISQPLSYYILPFNNKGVPVRVASGEKQVEITDVVQVLTNMYKLEGFTNNIASMFITDCMGLSYTVEGGSGTEAYVLGFHNPDEELELVTIGTGDDSFELVYVKTVRTFSTQKQNMGKKYEGYMQVKESKLLMHPYTVLTIDDMQGNRRDYRNEYIYSNDINVVMKGSMGTSNKTSFTVENYDIDEDNMFKQLMGDESAIIVNNPNDVTVITELLSAYLQGNKNSIENQKNTAVFNGAMSTFQGGAYAMGSYATGNAPGMVMGIGQAFQGAGNSVLTIQGIEAKQKDIGNIPPQIQKMGSNVSYNVGNGYNGLFVIKKQIKQEYIKKLTSFFNMYGYKKHEVKVPNLHTRKNWNYVQTESIMITGDFNTEDLNELKAFFDNGITLWHTDDIGNYDLSNEVI